MVANQLEKIHEIIVINYDHLAKCSYLNYRTQGILSDIFRDLLLKFRNC